MAIDPSIPLQVKRPQFIDPAQALSLRNMVQQFTMGTMELENARKQQQAQVALQALAKEPGAFDENGLPSAQYINRVAQVSPQTASELGKQRMVTLQALSTIQGQQALVDTRNAALADKKYEMYTKLRDASVPVYERAKQAGASDEEAERQYREAWQRNAEDMRVAGGLNFLPEGERDHYARSVPPYSVAAGGAMSLKDVTEQARRKEEVAARLEEQRESRRVREADIEGRAAEREDIRAEKRQLKQADAKVRVDTVTADLDAVARQAQRLLNHPGLEYITGPVMGRAPLLTADQVDADSLLEALKSQSFINALASIREASKTGGAVGNVTEREGDKLESFRGSLRRLQSTDQLKSVLQDIIKYADERKALVRRAYEESYPEEGGTAPSAPAPATPARPAQSQAYKPLPDKNRISELEAGEVYQTPSGPGRFTGRFDAQGRPQFERAGAEPPAAKSSPPGAPAPGAVVKGYRFKGGDPKDSGNWEKVQ